MTDASEASKEPGVPQVLNRTQRRVLGVLVEKAFCTPEYYPMTINAIVTGCNQKSNRDPIVTLSADDVEDALTQMQQMGLTTRVYPATGRTERWRHNLKDFWNLDRPQRAILAELMLRGEQSEGDLRARASRMVDIPTLEELRNYLEEMARAGFVRRLSPDEQKRGVIWTHLLLSPTELARVEQAVAQMPSPAEAEPAAPSAGRSSPVTSAAVSEIQDLRAEVEQLKSQVSQLQESLERVIAAHADLKLEFHKLLDELGN